MGSAANSLLDVAKGADLLVVGTRGEAASPASCSVRSASRSRTTRLPGRRRPAPVELAPPPIGFSIATVVAMALPYALARSGRDPAYGSGPLATVIQDLLSVIVYFAIATALI